MPRYFFHVREGAELSRDREGQELPDAEAARREAIAANREILGDKILHGGALNHRSIEIADETGHVVEVVTAHDVLAKGSFADDVTQTAPVTQPRKPPSR